MRTLRLSLLVALVPTLLAAQATPATHTSPRTMVDTTLKVERGTMRSQATFPLDSAKALTLRTVPGGVIQSSELEQEHGKLIYSFDVKVAGKRGIEEVNVNAKTGALIGREHEGDEDERAESAREQAPRTRPAPRPAPAAPAHP